jgi:hypothetical protein
MTSWRISQAVLRIETKFPTGLDEPVKEVLMEKGQNGSETEYFLRVCPEDCKHLKN